MAIYVMCRSLWLLWISISFAVADDSYQYWMYKSGNFLLPDQTEATIQLLERAGKLGYTHCLITDSKFSRLPEMPERYRKHIAAIKAAAASAKIELVPAICPVGYSNDLLYSDPNLIEGMPARDVPLEVQGGVAKLVPHPDSKLKGGDFTQGKTGWGWHDESIHFENGTAVSRNPNGKNSRLSQKVRLQPWRQYHLQVRIKSQDYQGTAEVKVIANGKVLNYDFLKVAPTQDWKTHHVVFNSQANTEADLYLGCWNGKSGELHWDDVVLEEVAFLNLIRREQAPFQLSTADGKPLLEGKDFPAFVDPLLGVTPYAGCYDVYHTPPHLKIPLPDGTKLLASYFHGVTIYDGQANLCVSEPKARALLKQQARDVHALFQAKGYFMSHDEIRVFNWSKHPDHQTTSAGQLLAQNVRYCIDFIREMNPGGRIYVWSDMFDPHHNAVKDYYLVNGDLTGAWEGLDAEVIIVPWAMETREKSMPFFAQRGHSQLMAGYYDGDAVTNAQAWLKTAAKIPKVTGLMYTTWQQDYSQLEVFIQAAKAARATSP
jgi:hypothetical protein